VGDLAPLGAPDPAFWRGRRVFVTGHTGFKGAWLTLWLESLGAEVTGYALEPPTEPSLFRQACGAAAVRTIVADVRDAERLAAAVAACRPEVVLHMAAQSVVKRGYADPIETYGVNVMGTVHLFEAVRRPSDACVVVNVTSDKCYAHRVGGPPYREDDAMGGDDPYSNSKGCAELVTTAYRSSFFASASPVALASARAGNAIGGGDWTAHQLIPDLVRSFAASQACRIRSPHGVRPWQFVLEPLRGYLMLAEALVRDPVRFAGAGTSGPSRMTLGPWRGSRTTLLARGANLPAGCSITRYIRRKRARSGSTSRRPGTNSAGGRPYRCRGHWTGSWSGTGPGRRGTIWRT
jgi:CDP-glucose 4,6-dehydratase